MSSAAGTDRRTESPDRVPDGHSQADSARHDVATLLAARRPDPFPSTQIRDWIALLDRDVLSDGAFRLYCVSRSLLHDNPKTWPPPAAAIEVSYERYGAILGRPSDVIEGFAEELFGCGLWREVDRRERDGATLVTVVVDDQPREAASYDGPVTAWDLLADTPAHPGADDRPDDATAPEAQDDGQPPQRQRSTRRADGDAHPPGLADELAMFTPETVEIVTVLNDKALTSPGLQPLTAADRAGLARRIESRLAQGWSAGRIRAVLTGGSLVGVTLPGRLWCGRLDDMPTAMTTGTTPGTTGTPDPGRRPAVPQPRRAGQPVRAVTDRRDRGLRTNDCSTLPEPNPGRTRYEVPDTPPVRMTVRWADDRSVAAWCGRCSEHSRCLRPTSPGRLPRPCPECHPEPDAFPPVAPEPPPEAASESAAPGTA